MAHLPVDRSLLDGEILWQAVVSLLDAEIIGQGKENHTIQRRFCGFTLKQLSPFSPLWGDGEQMKIFTSPPGRGRRAASGEGPSRRPGTDDPSRTS